jgi:hypothetical protein
MNQTSKIISIGVLLLLAIFITWSTQQKSASPLSQEGIGEVVSGEDGTKEQPGKQPVGSTPTKTASGKLEYYNDTNNGFIIYFPKELKAEPFSAFHLLSSASWRVNATGQKRGTPVIAIPVFRVDNQALTKKVYPLFYGTEVRVGVSGDTAQCYAKDDGYASQTITNVTIHGVTFKKFIFNDAAMMQSIGGVSYRTIHNKKCYVIEQVKTGSHYMDEKMTTEYTDAQLESFYQKTTPIVMSFTFTK